MINDIIGNSVSDKLNVNLSELRMLICKDCPLYKPNFNGLCNPALWLNPETGDVSNRKKDGYYKGCGCLLVNKTNSPSSHCPANKW